MRRSFGTLLGLGLITPLAIVPSASSAAANAQSPASSNVPSATRTDVSAATPSATRQDRPWSAFKVSVKAPKRVRNGSEFMYEVKVTNRGPQKADYFYVGGTLLPKGISRTVYYKGPKGTDCDFYTDGFWCVTPRPRQGRVGDGAHLDQAQQADQGHRGRQARCRHLERPDRGRRAWPR